jgi:hypothetical protein
MAGIIPFKGTHAFVRQAEEKYLMTLAELLPVIRELPAVDKLKLIHILAQELDTGEDIAPLVPHRVYQMPTPYGMVGAGRVLMGALETAENGG